MKKFICNKKGMAMPIAIIIGIIILATSITLLSLIDNSTRIRKVSENKISAKYAAEAGIQDGLYQYDLEVKKIQKNRENRKVIEFNGSGDIRNNSGEKLGEYQFFYVPPEINKDENKGVFNVIGRSNGADVKIKVEINTKDGSILSRVEK